MRRTVRLAALPGSRRYAASVNGRSLTLDSDGPSGRSGEGLSAGELLCLAAGAGFADQLLREAERREIPIARLNVAVESAAPTGGRTTGLAITVQLEADADEPTILDLVEHADRVCDVLNALRLGTAVRLADVGLLARR